MVKRKTDACLRLPGRDGDRGYVRQYVAFHHSMTTMFREALQRGRESWMLRMVDHAHVLTGYDVRLTCSLHPRDIAMRRGMIEYWVIILCKYYRHEHVV
jgi:hypothetical protein